MSSKNYPINEARKAATMAQYANIMSTGTPQIPPCKSCRQMQRRNPSAACIKDPTKSKNCACCVKGRKTCVFPQPAATQAQHRGDQVQPDVAVQPASAAPKPNTTEPESSKESILSASNGNSASGSGPGSDAAATASRHFPTPLVQKNLWSRMDVSDGQPKNATAEVAAGRYPTAWATIDGKRVQIAIMTPLEEVAAGTGVFRVKKDGKRLRGLGGGDGGEDEDEDGDEDGETGRRAKRSHTASESSASYYFACDGCGVLGRNFDDGQPQLICVVCKKHHHAECVEAGDDFVCEICRRKAKLAKENADLEGEDDGDKDPVTGVQKSLKQLREEGRKRMSLEWGHGNQRRIV